MLYFIYFLLFASSLASVPRPQKVILYEQPHDLEQYFEEFIASHGKQYAHEIEKKYRFEIFKQNIAKIVQKNADPEETATFGINQFSDLTTEEFIERHNSGIRLDSKRPAIAYENITQYSNVPDRFDWREKGVVTPVKDQGNCGCCWAFSAIGCVEGAYAIKHKSLKEFSEQQLVDCDEYENACNGGLPQFAILYIIDAGGVEGETNYPYTSSDGNKRQCKFDKSKVQGKVSKLLPFRLYNEEDTKQILFKYGPISFAIDSKDFQHYNGGILKSCSFKKYGHAVLLVGYGEENGIKYWIIKNSWGATWGDKGYIKVKYNGNGDNPCGMYSPLAAGVLAA